MRKDPKLSKNVWVARGKGIDAKALSVGILVILCCLSVESALASKKGRSLDAEEIATTWIGLGQGETAAYRLQLDSNGRGIAAIASKRDEPPLVFRLVSWTYNNGKIRIVGEPVVLGDDSYSPTFTGKVVGTRLKLIDTGQSWKVDVELRRESEMLDWLGRLQQAMAPLGNEK